MTTKNKIIKQNKTQKNAQNKRKRNLVYYGAFYFKDSNFATVNEFCKKYNIIQPNQVEFEIPKHGNWRIMSPTFKLEWRQQLLSVKWSKKGLFFVDEHNENVGVHWYEKFEQYLVYRWIKPNDIVLELGSRYGVVSCSLNSMLVDKTEHVVVEPDEHVFDALKKNKKTFNCKFKICRKIISNTPIKYISNSGIGNYIIEANNENINNLPQQHADIISTKSFFKKYPYKFNVLVADCEGCFLKFLQESGNDFISNLRMIIFEKDNEANCDYKLVEKMLINLGFKCVEYLVNGFQQVWCKSESVLS